jgi:hypothetical protein
MLDNTRDAERVRANSRYIDIARTNDPKLGPLKLLPGTWRNTEALNGRGWNLIALPFVHPQGERNFRVLMNQYNEELKFTFIDDNVPNRGLPNGVPPGDMPDQIVTTLDYQQKIDQIAARDDEAAKDGAGDLLAGGPGLAIHHEPGLFLWMMNRQTDGIDIARLATVPHGNAVTAIGRSEIVCGRPDIPALSAFPVGVADDIEAAVAAAAETDYLFPYKLFSDQPFKGILADVAEFPGFSPANANALLGALPPSGEVERTTILHLTTDASELTGDAMEEAGIRNIPFIERQADANLMRSTFWIMELKETDAAGNPKLLLAYSQFIFLDFFPRPPGQGDGLIRWPHISINVMEKVAEASCELAYLTTDPIRYA